MAFGTDTYVNIVRLIIIIMNRNISALTRLLRMRCNSHQHHIMLDGNDDHGK
jgi:hypothetical protein